MSRRASIKTFSSEEVISEFKVRETEALVELQHLQSRQDQLQEAVERFSEFYRNSPLPFVTFDFIARLVRINAAAARLLHVEPAAVKGISFTTLLRGKRCDRFLDHLRRCRRSRDESVESEMELRVAGGSIPVRMISCRIPTDRGELYETAIIDLSQQKATEGQLRRAWEHAEAIVLTIPNPVLVLDKHGLVINANRAFYDVFNASQAQTLNWAFMQLPEITWGNPRLEKLLLESVLEGGAVVQDLQIQATLQNQSVLTLLLNARLLRPGAGASPMLLLSFEDTTRRCRIEKERENLVVQLEEARAALEARVEERTLQLADSLKRLRDVSEQLVLAHESEQKRIARELHDQVGQDLTALKIIFSRSGHDLSNPARQTFLDAEKVTEEAIQNIRNICGTLRPQVLDDLGLLAGLSTHFKTFGARSNLEIEFEHNNFDEKRLSPILQSAIFRVIQEALTNVARHAQTNHATVVIWMTDHEVMFRVQDRGKGFRPQERLHGHNGLSNMRERVSLVNGHYELKSRPGRGTTIQVQIPLKLPSPEISATTQLSTPQNNGTHHRS